MQNFNSSCNLIDEVILRNSGYSDFKNKLLPTGKGSIIAVFSNYYDDFQLYIRNPDDVEFSDERCDYSQVLVPTNTINEIRDMFSGSMVEFGITNNYVIEGYVISSDESGSFQNRLLIQDAIENPTVGIQILLEGSEIFNLFNVGDKVFVNLNRLYMSELDGILSVGFPNGNNIDEIDEADVGKYIFNSGENNEIIPTEIVISEITIYVYQNTLVKVGNVQLLENELGSAFANFSGNDDGTRTLETCSESNKLSVFTSGDASYANELFPQGNGTIIGILTSNLEMRKLNDIDFLNDYEDCPVIVAKIMITEVADPKNSTTSRFVELYNAGDSEINLEGWKLNKYNSGGSSVSGTAVDLSGITIQKEGFVIIANTGFAGVFSMTPTIETTYISGNGDDVYELVDNTDTTIDIYGVIGEDGNGTNWEYLDGKAIRNIAITEPNPIFDISEWTVYSDASNSLISFPSSPQNAPGDFGPWVR